MVWVVIEKASVTAQAMVKSGAPSANHSFLGKTLSALSESHPSARFSIFARPSSCDGDGNGTEKFKRVFCSSTPVLLIWATDSYTSRLTFLLPSDEPAKIDDRLLLVENGAGLALD
jgi:hypothetical protein